MYLRYLKHFSENTTEGAKRAKYCASLLQSKNKDVHSISSNIPVVKLGGGGPGYSSLVWLE